MHAPAGHFPVAPLRGCVDHPMRAPVPTGAPRATPVSPTEITKSSKLRWVFVVTVRRAIPPQALLATWRRTPAPEPLRPRGKRELIAAGANEVLKAHFRQRQADRFARHADRLGELLVRDVEHDAVVVRGAAAERLKRTSVLTSRSLQSSNTSVPSPRAPPARCRPTA